MNFGGQPEHSRANCSVTTEWHVLAPTGRKDQYYMARFRNVCFTSFTDAEEKKEPDWERVFRLGELRYLAVQRERCPDTGRAHWQGYAELSRQARLGRVKELLEDEAAHVERRRGTAREASEYCQKADTRDDRGDGAGPFVFGEISHPGKRSDLIDAVDTLRESRSLREVANRYPQTFVRYHRGFRAWLGETVPLGSRGRPTLECYVGPSGIGKSRLAHHRYPGADIVDDNVEGWFDGLSENETVIINNFQCLLPGGAFCRLVDYHPFRARVKGGYVLCRATRIVVTTTIPTATWYTGTPYYVEVQRRVREFGVFIDVATECANTFA